MKRRVLLAAILLCTFYAGTKAQNFELGGISQSFFSASAFKDSDGSAEMELEEFNVFFNVSTPLKGGKSFLIHGLDYTRIRPTVSTDSPAQSGDWHRVSYKLTWIKMLKNNWNMTVTATPTLSSTFDNDGIELDDFIFQSSVSFVKTKNESVSYGFGATLGTQFGSPLPIPILIYNKRYEKARLEVVLPSHISYMRQYGALEVGPKLSLSGNKVNTNYSQGEGSDSDEHIETINFSRVVFGPSVKYRLNGLMVFELYGGVALARNYKIRDTADTKYDFSLENGAFANVSLTFSPSGKQ